MSISYAQDAQITCPQCGQPFAAAVWLIVDVAERPDLRQELAAGRLHRLACPHCGHEGEVDAPVLVVMPAPAGVGAPRSAPDKDAELARLIFSPANNTTAEHDQQHAAGLLATLAERMGDAWQEEWLTSGLRVLSRPMLAAIMGDDPEGGMQRAAEEAVAALDKLRREDPAAYEEFASAVRQVAEDVTTGDPFLAGVGALGAAQTPLDFLRVARHHPALLDQEGAIRVHEGVANARKSGETAMADDLEHRYEALCQVLEAIQGNGLSLDEAIAVAEEMER